MNQTGRNDSFDVLTIFNPSPTDFPVYYNSELHAVIHPGKAIQLVKLIAGDDKNGAVKHLIDRMCRLQKKPKNEPSIRAAWYEKVVLNAKRNEMPKSLSVEELAIQQNQQIANQNLEVGVPTVTTPPPSVAVPPSIGAVPNGSSDEAYIAAGYKFHPVTGARLEDAKPVITPDQVDTSHVQVQTDAGLPAAAVGVPTPGVTPPAAPLPSTGDPATDNLLAGIRGDGQDGEGKVIGEVDAEVEAPPAQFEKNWPDNPTKDDLMRYAQTALGMNLSDEQTKKELEDQSVDQLKATLKYDPYA